VEQFRSERQEVSRLTERLTGSGGDTVGSSNERMGTPTISTDSSPCGLSSPCRLSLGEDKAGASRRLVMPSISSHRNAGHAGRDSAPCALAGHADIHHANHVRPNPDGAKVAATKLRQPRRSPSDGALFSLPQQGTAWRLNHMRRRSFTPFSICWPVAARLFDTLRAYKGLQAYPSRTKTQIYRFFHWVGWTGAVAPRLPRWFTNIHRRILGMSLPAVLLPCWVMPNWTKATSGKRCWMRRSKGWITCCGLLI